MIFELDDTSKVKHIFDGWNETLIYSCIQKVMGKIYVTDIDNPKSAFAFVGCFGFFGGEPEKELVINKPDGFCFVAPGEEEAFMLGLPLSKLWGAGEKTVEKLKKSGFSSIKDIHSASLELLQSIFGKAGGSFLYMAVRGQAAETFGSDAKNHSISGERTFPYDLTDSYIIETALLQLCTEVQMRMLTENWYSHTIHLKIRYGDFTTVGIQRSYDQNFETENELYERVKSLFYEKWEKGRGIRLLGVGAGNCTHTPSQQFELFERDNQKTKDLEKAVLQINRKNKASGVKLQKARLMEAKNIVPPKER